MARFNEVDEEIEMELQKLENEQKQAILYKGDVYVFDDLKSDIAQVIIPETPDMNIKKDNASDETSKQK